MATAYTVITDALKEIGVIAEGETPSGTMADDAFRALNRLADKMSNDQAFAFYASTETRNLTGESSFTIGPTGDVIATRPIRIDTATVDRNGITYPVTVIDNQKWDSIIYKGAQGANTTAVYYEARFPNAIVHVWPLATGCTLNMRVLNNVVTFANQGTALALPPGYEEFLIKALAVNIHPQYPASILNPRTVSAAKDAWAYIRDTNNVVPTMTIDSNLVNRHGGSLAAFLGGY
jgi:hypothetical protein